MKPILLIVAIVFIPLLTGCGLPGHSTRPPCEKSQTFVEYEKYLFDKTNEFVGGMMCIGTNIEASYTITHNLDMDFTLTDVSLPQLQANIDNCIIISSGTYSVKFGNVGGYATPPTDAEVIVKKGVKAKIYGYYGAS